MEEILAFKSLSGKLFLSKEEALEDDKDFLFSKELEKFLENNEIFYDEGFYETINSIIKNNETRKQFIKIINDRFNNIEKKLIEYIIYGISDKNNGKLLEDNRGIPIVSENYDDVILSKTSPDDSIIEFRGFLI